MKKSFQTSNFKLQTPGKLQLSKSKDLNFGVWCLVFVLRGCVKIVDKVSRSLAQRLALYPQSTPSPNYLTGQGLFVRRFYTAVRDLITTYTNGFSQNPPVKFSYAHFTQDLLIQFNKESY